MVLSTLLGRPVRRADGSVVGRLADLTVSVGDAHPRVERLVLRSGRAPAWVAADDVEGVPGADGATLRADAQVIDGHAAEHLGEHELLVVRDVLDTQVVDIAGRRVARVADVVLERNGDSGLRLVTVDVGSAGVWRRLGLGRLAARSTDELVDWVDLHLTSGRGHALHLVHPDAGVTRLTADEVATVVANLPPHRAAAVLDAVGPATAVAARGHVARRPRRWRFRGIRRHRHRLRHRLRAARGGRG